MENINEALKTILASNMMASSLAELAETLGYKGRSSLYRVTQGTASERAIAGLCQKIKEVLHFDADNLTYIATLIEASSQFNHLFKSYLKPVGKAYALDVIIAFVSHDFRIFPDDFIENELNTLLSLERSNPDEFYLILACFFIKYSQHADYYVKGLTHRQRCISIIEPLGEQLIELYPENGLAINSVYMYSKSEVFNCETPVLWSLVQNIGSMLNFFGRPIETLQSIVDIRFLSGLAKRTYWTGRDNDSFILTNRVTDINIGSGHYGLYRVEKQSSKITFIGQLNFMSDDMVIFNPVQSKPSKLGIYNWDGKTLSLLWENPDDDPTGFGNIWTVFDKSCSQNLRNINKSLSDKSLFDEMLTGEGWTIMPEYEVVDVIISRDQLDLQLVTGQRLSIKLSEASFLHKIKPADPVRILRLGADDAVYVVWFNQKHALPLELFSPVAAES